MALAVLSLARRRRELTQVGEPAAAGPTPLADHHMLSVRSEHGGETSVISLWGELDIAATAMLEAEVIVAHESGARAITLDLSGLDFLDSAGLRAILDAQEHCRRRGLRMDLLRGPAQVQRIFALTQTADRLAFLD